MYVCIIDVSNGFKPKKLTTVSSDWVVKQAVLADFEFEGLSNNHHHTLEGEAFWYEMLNIFTSSYLSISLILRQIL